MENEKKLSEEEILKENLRVQKTEYIKRQMERRHAAEDARLERLLQEQEVIDELRKAIDDNMWQTEELRKYNQEFQEQVNLQIYESHGITSDKLMGMREYKNAAYWGSAAVLILLSVTLSVLCGVLHGFQSDIYLLMFAYTAMEGALLAQKQKSHFVLELICRILFILTFPTMMVMFVCYELQYEEYGLFLPYAAVLGLLVTLLGTISYFLRDPYSKDKKKLRDAKSQIRDIERLAGKEVKKSRKTREKEERKVQKLMERKDTEKRENFLARFKKTDKLPDKPEEETVTETCEAELTDNGEECSEQDNSEKL